MTRSTRPESPARKPYRMIGPATWELARAAYLGGETARSVAARLGIGLHNLRRKISEEGWSKKALARARTFTGTGPDAGTGTTTGPTDPALPAEPTEDLMTTVMRRTREALRAGRSAEAAALMKAARDYVLFSQDINDARVSLDWIDDMHDDPPEEGIEAYRTTLMTSALRQFWTPMAPDTLRARFEAIDAQVPETEEVPGDAGPDSAGS